MKKVIIPVIFAVALNVHAAELFVDGTRGDDENDGTAAEPFKTIGAALQAAWIEGGDTITISAGTYRENLNVNGILASKEKPLIIQGVPGERVIITGFMPISGWKPLGRSQELGVRSQNDSSRAAEAQQFGEPEYSLSSKQSVAPIPPPRAANSMLTPDSCILTSGIYTAEVPYFIQDLYVGLQQQPVSRWPRNELMRRLHEYNATTQTFSMTDEIPDTAEFQAIAEDPKLAQIFMYLTKWNVFATFPLVSLDIAGRKLVTKTEKDRESFSPQDRGNIVNHPALIKDPGDWAVVESQTKGRGKHYTVYFMPRTPEDFKSTYYRSYGDLIGVMSGVVLRNLEICGAGHNGIRASGGYKDITIENCIVHNNANGIFFLKGEGATVRSCLIVGNGNGISIGLSKDVLIEGNEICHNWEDGVRVTGGGLGTEDYSSDVTVRRNYIHHHFYLSHPDNIQTFAEVKNLKIHDNFLAYAAQNTMVEHTSDSEFVNNISICAYGWLTMLLRESSSRWTVKNNTLGFGGSGSFIITSKDNAFTQNILINSLLDTKSGTQSDWNYYIPSSYAPTIIIRDHKAFEDIKEAAAATGMDANSIMRDTSAASPFKNVPKAYAVAGAIHAHSTTASVIAFDGRSDFAVGDNVEINGDGVMRKVTEATARSIKFEPALPSRPFRNIIILNWGESESTEFDFTIIDSTSPVLNIDKDGSRIGSTLDVGAFYRGELLEKGKRTLPEIPADLKAAWPDPNHFIVPMRGI